MTRLFRFLLAGSWLVAAFVLLRMAYGGGPGGILYVIQFNHPAVLLAGAVTIVGAFSIAFWAVFGPVRRAIRSSIALAVLAMPFSLVLATQDHGSAPALGAAAVAALLISVRALTGDAPAAAT